MDGILHFEPMDPPNGPITKRWAPYVGNFFRCHLQNDKAACDLVYGAGRNSLCHRYAYASCTHT